VKRVLEGGAKAANTCYSESEDGCKTKKESEKVEGLKERTEMQNSVVRVTVPHGEGAPLTERDDANDISTSHLRLRNAKLRSNC
jgi:hypothetical protein